MTKSKSTDTAIVRAVVNADAVGRLQNGNVVVRRGFFYRHGCDAEKFAAGVKASLDKAGIKYQIVDTWEKWTAFNGSSKLANSSHWGVELKLLKE
jgi:hypothetical protein